MSNCQRAVKSTRGDDGCPRATPFRGKQSDPIAGALSFGLISPCWAIFFETPYAAKAASARVCRRLQVLVWKACLTPRNQRFLSEKRIHRQLSSFWLAECITTCGAASSSKGFGLWTVYLQRNEAQPRRQSCHSLDRSRCIVALANRSIAAGAIIYGGRMSKYAHFADHRALLTNGRFL